MKTTTQKISNAVMLLIQRSFNNFKNSHIKNKTKIISDRCRIDMAQYPCVTIPYGEKFSGAQIFAVFTDLSQTLKIFPSSF